LTATGLVVGTPAYLPPERLAGRPATVASDIYGVGVVLYQAVSGQSPFEPGVPLPALASSEPWPLRERRPDIAPALDAVITRAMARDPSARFATAAEMAAALRAASAESAAGVLRAASAETVTAGAAPAAATATTVASVPAPPPLTEVMVPRGDRRAPTGWVGRRVVTAAAVAALVLLVSLLVLVAGGNRSAPASQISVPSTTSVAPAVAAPTTIASTPAPNPATVASATAGRAPAAAHTDKGKKKKK
ncbi:MAG: eukaryotic-like serine/threonine-protein kinase, partial [Acidimicrobiaceae bacterium]|nr:eukaryotic-like serine/threonine-protein kinase [Acidimicrobiaceae bacterium]